MKKIISAVLFSALIFSLTLSMTSCYLLDFDGIFADDGSDTDEPGAAPEITVNGGDNNYININSDAVAEYVTAGKALLSTVRIVSIFDTYTVGDYGQGSRGQDGAEGSGVIYKLDKENGNAYIITNYHVVYNPDSIAKNKISTDISILLYGQEYQDYVIEATYVGGSMNYDLAVLEVKNSEVLMKSAAMAADFADSNEVSVLERVIAVGNPEGDGISATVGYINVESEDISMLGSDEKTPISLRVMRTDAAVNHGNSGGGLFNVKGEVIGIVNAKKADSSVDNIGYAIPSNVAKAIADNILYYCADTTSESVQRVIMGIQVTSSELSVKYNAETGKVRRYEDVTVYSIESDSFVKDILAVGDIINSITIDGKHYEVNRVFHVVDSMLNARASSSVTMNITRQGTVLDVAIPISDNMLTPQA